MSDAAAPNADWYPDPSGRYQFRYWDGQEWTGHVSTEGETAWDPPEGQGEEAVAAETEVEAAEPVAAAPQEHPEPAAAEATDADGQWAPTDVGDTGDTNRLAIAHAGLADDTAEWLNKVADQVDPRLDRINDGWRSGPQAEAARACAFGLLLGHLATLYPHMRDELSDCAEAHPSFSTLDEGSRLQTLEQIAGEHSRAAAWLGPLIDAEDPDRVAMLFD